MHQALIAITLIAGQAYLEESRITSLADFTPEKENSIVAEDLSKNATGLEIEPAVAKTELGEESIDDLIPDIASTDTVDGKKIAFDETEENPNFAEIIPEDEMKEGESGISGAITEVSEEAKEVATGTVEKVKKLVSDEEKKDSSESDKKEAEKDKSDEKIKTDEISKEITVATTGLEIKTIEDEVTKKTEEKKETEKTIETVKVDKTVETTKAEEGVKEVKGKTKDEIEKITDEKDVKTEAIVIVEEKASDVKKEDEKIATESDQKISDAKKEIKKEIEKNEEEIETSRTKKPEVVSAEEVSIKTLLIKPKKVVAEKSDNEDSKLDTKQKKALDTALKKSEEEAGIIFLTDEEKLELLLEARDEMLEEEEKKKELAIIPREKVKRKFIQENIPSELISNDRSTDNRHIPMILSDDDLIEIAFSAIRDNDSTKLRSIVKDLRDPNIINKLNGETALTYATKYRSYAIMKFLMYYGADLNIGNYKSNSPLHIAVNNNDEYALGLLLERSADINVGNGENKTPLMLAIETNQPNMVKTLVRYGSDLNATDSKGLTALDIARKHKNRNVEKFILQATSEKKMLSAKRSRNSIR